MVFSRPSTSPARTLSMYESSPAMNQQSSISLEVPQPARHVLVVGGVGERDADQRGDAEAERGGVDGGAVAGDDPGRLQPVDAVGDAGSRQADEAPQLRVGGPAVLPQGLDELPVHRVHAIEAFR